MNCATEGINMIEQYGRYRLKRIRGWGINDNREYTVIGFYSADTVLCESPCGELYVFLKERQMMIKKDYMLYGTTILNLKTQEIGLLICLWENKYTDKIVDFATCVDKTGKRYNIELDNIRGFEDDFEK